MIRRKSPVVIIIIFYCYFTCKAHFEKIAILKKEEGTVNFRIISFQVYCFSKTVLKLKKIIQYSPILSEMIIIVMVTYYYV